MSKMTKRKRQTIKMIFVTVLTFISFVTEIVVGYRSGSLALINDAFNMISALISLVVGLVCLWLSTKTTKKNTYGWARVEIWAALVNSVTMMALCFTIFTGAIVRLITPEKVDGADLVLITGGVGLAVNIIGIVTFIDEAFEGNKKEDKQGNEEQERTQTTEEGHTNPSFDAQENVDPQNISIRKVQSEAQIGRVIPERKRKFSMQFQEYPPVRTLVDLKKTPVKVHHPMDENENSIEVDEGVFSENDSIPTSKSTASHEDTCLDIPEEEEKECISCANRSEDEIDDILSTITNIATGRRESIAENTLPQPDAQKKNNKKIKSANQMNIQGVFLHILGDALGSVSVIVSGLVNKYFTGDWVDRIDPALSLAVVAVVVCTITPLFIQTSNILLQRVPKNVNVQELLDDLKRKVNGIAYVHDLHIWQLAGSRIIASLHIRCTNLPEYITISKKIKTFFHDNGIHSTTIQPEFMEHQDGPTTRECYLECGPELKCHEDTCCCVKKKSKKKISTTSRASGISTQTALSADTAIWVDSSDLDATSV